MSLQFDNKPTTFFFVLNMASFCEKCRKTEYEHQVLLKRCGNCKNVFYCSPACQKSDWKDHKFLCRKPEALIRKEAEKGGFMGMKNNVNVPVDVDPVTGDFDLQPLLDRIKMDQQPVGKAKVSAPPKPKTWAYKVPETEEERASKMEAFVKELDFAQFGANETRGWELMSPNEKDFVWALWQLFSEGEKRLPLLRSDTRCARELVKWVGGRYEWVGKQGSDWVGLPQSDKSRDLDIQQLIEDTVKTDLKANLGLGFDCTLLARFFAARRFANK